MENNDNKENGEGASEDNEKKEVKIQENVDIGEIEQDNDKDEDGGGLSRAMRAATMVQKNQKVKNPTRWDVFWMQFWYFCDDPSLHGWNYVARFPGAGAKGWVHSKVATKVVTLGNWTKIPTVIHLELT